MIKLKEKFHSTDNSLSNSSLKSIIGIILFTLITNYIPDFTIQ